MAKLGLLVLSFFISETLFAKMLQNRCTYLFGRIQDYTVLEDIHQAELLYHRGMENWKLDSSDFLLVVKSPNKQKKAYLSPISLEKVTIENIRNSFTYTYEASGSTEGVFSPDSHSWVMNGVTRRQKNGYIQRVVEIWNFQSQKSELIQVKIPFAIERAQVQFGSQKIGKFKREIVEISYIEFMSGQNVETVILLDRETGERIRETQVVLD